MLTSIKSTTAKKIAGNTLYQLIGKVVSMSITILATILIARVYGRESFGEFSLMQGIPALFLVIVDFGLNAIATRELAKDFSKAERYLGNILFLRFFGSIVLMLLVAFSVSFFPYSDGLKLGIYLSTFLILTQALYSTTNIIFQVKLRYDLSVFGYIVGSLVVLGLVIALSFLHADVMWLNFSYVVGGFVTFLLNLYFLRKFINLRQLIYFDKNTIKYFLVQSFPLGLMFLFSQLNFKADTLLLSVLSVPESLGLSTTDAVALYSLPYKIFEVALVVPTFLMNAVYPVFVSYMEESTERFRHIFFKTLFMLALAGVIGSILGVIFAPFAVSILGGDTFKLSVMALRLLVLGLPIFYVTQPLAWLLVLLNKQKRLPYIYAVSAVVNISLNVYLIPKYSFYASAVVTWISELVILALLAFYSAKEWKLKNA